ncbi:UPF0481 protein At3g47200-like [Diospyros lotus]|uniref:UPF0481 protein At3g47200-like n=1 Tax=Diospyros lotus TaxID=55363 RepID=UPI0022564AD1|nr:UPF0481 protein At3g47200-like [Diospyros lotus]
MSDWVLDIKAELNNRRNAQSQEEQRRKKRSIYKLPPLILPPSISDDKKKPYQPQAVSFGPYHHGELHLKPVEDHKHRVFLNFLDRPGVCLRTIFNSMLEVAQDLQDSYYPLDPKWENGIEEFVKLMIVDGCFMLEIMRVMTNQPGHNYSDDDPIFSHHGKVCVMPLFKRDMLLLENQLPMLVLFKLMEENDMGGMETLKKLILNFFNRENHGLDMGNCLHILDLYGKTFLYYEPQKDSRESKDILTSRSATELKAAGIRFEKSKSESLNDISFKHGVLSLPKFIVDDITESTFLNLIAFERCHVGAGHDVISFISFMDVIVNQDRDISLLSSHGIILNFAGTDEAAADLFNVMSKDLMIDSSSHLNMVLYDIDFYCSKPWHKWRAMLFHTYFRSPWAIISVVAAIILFVLTTVSTVFIVMGK